MQEHRRGFLGKVAAFAATLPIPFAPKLFSGKQTLVESPAVTPSTPPLKMFTNGRDYIITTSDYKCRSIMLGLLYSPSVEWDDLDELQQHEIDDEGWRILDESSTFHLRRECESEDDMNVEVGRFIEIFGEGYFASSEY